MMKLVALTGGMGSGKSVVAHILKTMDYEVYDTDSQAKRLMTNNNALKFQLIDAFGEQVYQSDGSINRRYLSAKTFTDPEARYRLNGIVHPAVRADLHRWVEELTTAGAKMAFFETALLHTGGLDSMVNEVWRVIAPLSVRIARVKMRSHLTEEQIMARIAAQANEDKLTPNERQLINDGIVPLLPQVLGAING